MSIIRSGNARQYLKSISDFKAHKFQSISLTFTNFIDSSQLRIHNGSRYRSLPVHNGASQKPGASLLVQERALNHQLSSHLATWHHISASHPATSHQISAPYPATHHHIAAASYSGIGQLGHFRNTSSSQNFDDYFNRRSNGYNRTRDASYSNQVKYLFHFLTGVGLSYIIYRVKDHIQGLQLSNILPVASCSSEATQSEAEPTQKCDCSSKESHKKPKKEKKSHKKPNKAEGSSGTGRDQGIPLREAVERTQKLCRRRKEEVGSPGIVVCVSVDGNQVYAEGFGYSDLENEIPMKPTSVLRIASISKAVTATIVAKAWEEGRIDLEKPVQHYVPSFPQKEFMGEKVEITVQQLLNHTSGIRHYKPKDDPVYAFDKPIANLIGLVKNASWQSFYKTGPILQKATSKEREEENQLQKKETKKKLEVSEMEREEYYLMKHFSTTEESLALFANDPLIARPGTKYVYSTFAYTLLAAVVEAALKSPFTNMVTKTLGQMGLSETYLDYNRPIIYNRAQYYVKDDKGKIVNAPYVDNSYKWAGGGLLSTSEDMVKFGNILLYCAQHQDQDTGPPGFLKSSTMWKFWSSPGKEGATSTYGLGFEIRPANKVFGMCEHKGFGAGHTGGAVGASSVLFILPRQSSTGNHYKIKNSNSQGNVSKVSRDKSALPADTNTSASVKSTCEPNSSESSVAGETSLALDKNRCQQTKESVRGRLPQGVVVCIILNMMSVSAQAIAEDIAKTFEKVDFAL